MGSYDSFSLNALTEGKLAKIRKDKARKEQEYYYLKQEEQMTDYLKQSLIDQNKPIPEPANLEGKAPQGIVPYVDPNKSTRMSVTDLFGKGTDADSMWGLNPLDTYYDVGIRADSGINTAEHGTYASKGAQDQLATQRIYFGMLYGLFPPEIDPSTLSDDELKQYVSNEIIFNAGKKAAAKSREAALQGWNVGENPELDVSYDPNAMKHLGDKRIRGRAINPRTGVNIHDVVNLPEYNINWFSPDPEQTAVRQAYEAKYGTDYSRFKNYKKSQISQDPDGSYKVQDLHSGKYYSGLNINQAQAYEKAIEENAGPTNKPYSINIDEGYIPETGHQTYDALSSIANIPLKGQELVTEFVGGFFKAPSGLFEQGYLNSIPEEIRTTVLDRARSKDSLKFLKDELNKVKDKDWVNQGYKDYLATEINKAENIQIFTNKQINDFVKTPYFLKNRKRGKILLDVKNIINSYELQRETTNMMSDAVERAKGYFGASKEFTGDFYNQLQTQMDQAGKQWNKGDYGQSAITFIDGLTSAVIENPGQTTSVAISDLLPSTMILAKGGVPALTLFATDLNAEANRTYQNKYGKTPTSAEQAQILAISTLNAYLDRLSDRYILNMDNAVAKKLIEKIGNVAKPIAGKLPDSVRLSTKIVAKLTNKVVGKPLAEGLQEATQSVMEDYAGTLDTASIDPKKAFTEGALGVIGGATAGPVTATGAIVTESAKSAYTGNNNARRLQEKLDAPEYIPLSEKEETKLVDQLTKYESELLNKNITEKRKQKIQTQLDKINQQLEQGKLNPKYIAGEERIALTRRLEAIKAITAKKEAEEAAKFKAAGKAASAAQPAATTEQSGADAKILASIIRNFKNDAVERTVASEALATKLAKDQDVTTAETVQQIHAESTKNAEESSKKLNSLANVIDIEETVDPEQLNDNELKDIYDLVESFKNAQITKDLEAAANDTSTGASQVSSDIAIESRNNYKSIQDHLQNIVKAIKNNETAGVLNLLRNLRRFTQSETRKAKRVAEAVRYLRTGTSNEPRAVVITRTTDPNTKVVNYTPERVTLAEAQEARSKFEQEKANGTAEVDNVFFLGEGKISAKLAKAIELESKFTSAGLEIANELLRLAEDIQANKDIASNLEESVSQASDIINSTIPETRSTQRGQASTKEAGNTQQAEPGTTEKVSEKDQQTQRTESTQTESTVNTKENQSGNQEEVQEKRQQTSDEEIAILDTIILPDDLDEAGRYEATAKEIKEYYDKRIKLLKIIGKRVKEGKC